ncbi:hypothetical protein ACFFMN_23040 [Planobispora siamensis]|uniref:Uncharacterized protein n=1 Tax=Planobispora siamensis TaxID=936338 RepID=A0A8J3SLH2_9ACTN|nr:hypothetical protein [Planobispora siamensis]GIH95444.1 hypothetical protein Psi01_60740 [Planobispora siamensis]
MKVERQWVTTDFQPASDGWRLLYLLLPPVERGFATAALPGWLVQEEVLVCAVTGSRLVEADQPPSRRVVAATVDGAALRPADDDPAFWRLMAPGEPPPTLEDLMQAWQDRSAADA